MNNKKQEDDVIILDDIKVINKNNPKPRTKSTSSYNPLRIIIVSFAGIGLAFLILFMCCLAGAIIPTI